VEDREMSIGDETTSPASAEAARLQAAAEAEAKDRARLRALAEKVATAARRTDKQAVVDEILHALVRPF
jgi:hypothetical protein